ncbi:2-amino-5-chloromuconate deaminase CnbZ [Bradyrhizobium sp. UFLA05-112]
MSASHPATKPTASGGYSYIPFEFQYSSGVAALPGFRLERARFNRLVPMAEGFARIKAHLGSLGRPLTAFAACELRSTLPFTADGFREFNLGYAQVLREWGIMKGEDNPVARSNVCPELDPPTESGFYAFTYTVPDTSAAPTFLISGGAETRSATVPQDRIVAFGDTSPAGLRAKAQQTLGEMEKRLAAFGFGWADTTAVQVYTVFDLHPFFLDEITARGAACSGLTWYPCRPPVQKIDFEMDCRGLTREIVLSA